jgi:hypothetical protein
MSARSRASFFAGAVVIAACAGNDAAVDGDATIDQDASTLDASTDRSTAPDDTHAPPTCAVEEKSTSVEKPAPETPFVFQVISDVHAHRSDTRSYDNIVTALTDLKSVGPTTKALVINGDLTEHGYADDYAYLKSALSGRTPPLTLFNMGNHEFHGSDSSATEVARYLSFTGLSRLYYEHSVAGYPFLFLAGENGDGDLPKLAWTAMLSDAQLAWLDERLTALASETRPTFVFLHQGPWDSNAQPRLKKILGSHPRVVYFWSHWHRDLHTASLGSNMYTDADGYLQIHTGAVQYCWDAKDVMHYDWAQGVQVEVFSDRITFRGRDCTARAWIPQQTHVQHLRAPVSLGSAEINADGRLELVVVGSSAQPRHAVQTTAGAGSSTWNEQTGALASAPVVAQHPDGRLEAFARGADSALWHSAQAAPSGAWSPWSSLGGKLIGNIAVATNADGRLELFARGTDDALYHRWEIAGGAWSDWVSLGGFVTSDPAVARNADGRLEVFARGMDGSIAHRWQATPSGAWTADWSSLGGVSSSNVAVLLDHDGRLRVFARGTNDALFVTSQNTAGGGWSPWIDLGGVHTSDPVAIADADGTIEVFTRGEGGVLQHARSQPGDKWSPWTRLGGSLTSDPVVARNADGRLEVFARGEGDRVQHVWQQEKGGCWSSWASLDGEAKTF